MIGPESQFFVPQWLQHDIFMVLGICAAAIIHRFAEGWVDDIRSKKNGTVNGDVISIPIDKQTLIQISNSIKEFAEAQSSLAKAMEKHALMEVETNQFVRSIHQKVME